jgi:hypothetical protein
MFWIKKKKLDILWVSGAGIGGKVREPTILLTYIIHVMVKKCEAETTCIHYGTSKVLLKMFKSSKETMT